MASAIGSVLATLGLVVVGASVLYAGTALSASATLQQAQQAQQVVKDANTLQGIGWILAGLGLGIALFPQEEDGGAKTSTTANRPPDIDFGPRDEDLPPPLKE